MSSFRSVGRALESTLAILLVGGVLVSGASGALTIHLRPVGAPENGGVLVVTDPAAPIPMEIWAVVTGQEGNLLPEGLWKFYSAFYTSNQGLVKGDLSAEFYTTIIFPNPDPQPAPPYWGKGFSASVGTSTDLDGDGDLDIGDTNPAQPSPPWFQAKETMVEGPWTGWGIFGYGLDGGFNIAALTLNGGTWGPEYDPAGQSGVTEVWALPRQADKDALWQEDGHDRTNATDPSHPDYGVLQGGEKVLLVIQSDANAPDGGPEGFKIAPGDAPLMLDGMASTGSVNWWGWDFDGDGDYEIEGVGLSQVDVTYDDLVGMGLVEGVEYHAQMAVGWAASDPVNVTSDGFTLTLVPEPATLALLALGSVASLIRRRR